MRRIEIMMKTAWIALLATALLTGCETGTMDNQGTVSLNQLQGIPEPTPEPETPPAEQGNTNSQTQTNSPSGGGSTGSTSTTPDGGTVSNEGFPAEIDTPIKWLHTDVSRWPVTADISVSVSGGKVNFPYSKSRSWPAVDGVNANPWVFAKKDGQWYAATFEWLRFGQTAKPTYTVRGDHVKVAPLNGSWAPRSGERIGIMVSGLARHKQRNVQERSRVVMITWP